MDNSIMNSILYLTSTEDNKNKNMIRKCLEASLKTDLLSFHRIEGFVYKYCVESYLNDIEYPMLKERYLSIKRNNEIFIREIEKIAKAFSDHNVSMILLKGIPLILNLYKDFGVRQCSDVDILIDPKDADKVVEILESLEFIQGKYDRSSKKIIPASRKDIVKQKMNTHELHKFVAVKDGTAIYMDVNIKFSWVGPVFYKNIEIDYQLLLSKSQIFEYNETIFRHMSYEYFLLHLCLHIYNEAVFFEFQSRYDYDEIMLCKFYDIQMLLKMELVNWNDFDNILKMARGENQVSYVFTLLEILYPGVVDIPYVNSFPRCKVINEYFKYNGQVGEWKIGLFERIFNIENKIEEYKR